MDTLPKIANGVSPGEFHKIIFTDAGAKVVPLQRRQGAEKCVIDYLSFTVDESILRRIVPEAKPFTDEDYCNVWADYVGGALLRLQCKIKPFRAGLFGFQEAARVGDYGLVAAGGQHSSLYVQLSGHAFACADDDFPRRLHDFLKASRSANITRIDIAYDDFAGETFPVRSIPAKWQAGQFTASRSPRPPRFEQRGDWSSNDHDQRGLTVYIGSRDSGKWLRFYEKGRQLGAKSSEWVRAELELRGDVFFLIPEMLIHPTSYFVASYAPLAVVEYAGSINKLERIAREGMETVEKVLETIRHQYGGHLDVLRKEFFGNDKELLDRVCRIPRDVPLPLRKAIDLSNALDLADPAQFTLATHLEK